MLIMSYRISNKHHVWQMPLRLVMIYVEDISATTSSPDISSIIVTEHCIVIGFVVKDVLWYALLTLYHPLSEWHPAGYYGVWITSPQSAWALHKYKGLLYCYWQIMCGEKKSNINNKWHCVWHILWDWFGNYKSINVM